MVTEVVDAVGTSVEASVVVVGSSMRALVLVVNTNWVGVSCSPLKLAINFGPNIIANVVPDIRQIPMTIAERMNRFLADFDAFSLLDVKGS